jgi:hypothetical protein
VSGFGLPVLPEVELAEVVVVLPLLGVASPLLLALVLAVEPLLVLLVWSALGLSSLMSVMIWAQPTRDMMPSALSERALRLFMFSP